MSDPLDAIRTTFFEECRELMDDLERGLLAIEAGDRSGETVDAVFRAVHSVKGGAGAFGLTELAAFAHDFETVLDRLRAGVLAPDPAQVHDMLVAADVLADLVEAGERDARPDGQAVDASRTALAQLSAAARTDAGDAEDVLFDAVPLSLDLANEDAVAGDGTDAESGPPPVAWDIEFEPLPGLLESGNEPLHLFEALTRLGSVRAVCATDAVLPLDSLAPKSLGLSWRLSLDAPDSTSAEIEGVFAYAADLCRLRVVRTDADAVPARIPTAPVVAPEAEPARPTADRARPLTSVRVALSRVDELVNLVGEMVIAQAMLGQIASEPGRRQELVSQVDTLQSLTLQLQDGVMAIRALPVGPLFQRMSRIVREASQWTGKSVRLVTEGEDTHVDKAVIERLADPLTHMVRNAIDHGIEDAEARERAGKAVEGRITLSAAQRSDRVVVTIVDDGGGVDRDRVLRKARAAGLVDANAMLEPEEIDRLLFLPGFSTSDTVSDLSGRGVGMDVVARAIADLSGTISIRSRRGEGTRIVISLPLTLAILDGMIVTTGEERYVVPLSSILETQIAEHADLQRIGPGATVARLHDGYVPLHDLGTLLGRRATGTASPDRTILYLDPGDARPIGLLVDGIEAQRQVVVKGLDRTIGPIAGVSAATILGNGGVALILDAAGLAGLAARTPIPRRLAS